MAEFPARQSEVLLLAESMYRGYFQFPAFFPHISPTKLLLTYRAAIEKHKQASLARGELQTATAAKDKALLNLIRVMKDCLRRSEAEVSHCPEKLSRIGWGLPEEPSSLTPPEAPRNLRIVFRNEKGILLRWDKPQGGGEVRTYLLQKRTVNETEPPSEWVLFAVTWQMHYFFSSHNAAGQIELRILAASPAGQSLPSNSLTLSLPASSLG